MCPLWGQALACPEVGHHNVITVRRCAVPRSSSSSTALIARASNGTRRVSSARVGAQKLINRAGGCGGFELLGRERETPPGVRQRRGQFAERLQLRGYSGDAMRAVILGLFGVAGYLFPIAAVIVALLLFREDEEEPELGRMLLGVTLFVLGCLGILSIARGNPDSVIRV